MNLSINCMVFFMKDLEQCFHVFHKTLCTWLSNESGKYCLLWFPSWRFVIISVRHPTIRNLKLPFSTLIWLFYSCCTWESSNNMGQLNQNLLETEPKCSGHFRAPSTPILMSSWNWEPIIHVEQGWQTMAHEPNSTHCDFYNAHKVRMVSHF